jgi:hypothetical protein
VSKLWENLRVPTRGPLLPLALLSLLDVQQSQGFQCETCKSEALLATALPEDQYLSGAEIEERLYSILTKAVALPIPVRLLAIDFDATICQV